MYCWLLLVLISFSSCFHIGITDENQQYVPKYPAFKLKDKAGFFTPKDLTLPTMFKLESSFYQGVQSYPVDTNDPYAKYKPLLNWEVYMILYPKGRALKFGKSNSEALGLEHIEPNRDFSTKAYYFPIDSSTIAVEIFLSADGLGRYMKTNYTITNNGSTLHQRHDRGMDIYQLVDSDLDLNHFTINW